MKNKLFLGAMVAAMALGLPLLPVSAQSAFAGELKLTMQGGRVTILADRVPLRQILQEWARVGQTTIINADKMTGPAITLQLVDASERDALDILLRSASGYIAAPRPVPVTNAAFYDRVTIMATSRAPASTNAQAAPPPFQRPPTPMDDNDEPINVNSPNQINPTQVNPAFGIFPGMLGQPGQAQIMTQPNGAPIMTQPGQPLPTGTQGSPLTLPRPGAVPQPAQPPVNMINPYQTPVVGRPSLKPGGGGEPEAD